MKKALLFLLKLGLFIFFIHNLGIISYIANTEKHPPAPIKENFIEADMEWLNKKYEIALELGEQYSPELYFSDITDIQLRLNNNDFDRRALPSATGTITNLANIFHRNFSNLRFKHKSNKDLVNSYINRINKASEKYDEILNPGITAKRLETKLKVSQSGYFINLFLSLLLWLLKQYFKNLILAFFLLWIWWYQKQESIKITNPLSFLFCLLIYPFIITKTLKEKFNDRARYLIMTANYRQRQINLFSIFSENEIKEIRDFAKSNISLKKYQEILSNDNYVIRHSLISALGISLIFIILSASESQAQTKTSLSLNKTEITTNSPPSFISDIDIDFNLLFLDALNNFKFLSIVNKINKNNFVNEECLIGICKKIEHVPKFLVNNY